MDRKFQYSVVLGALRGWKIIHTSIQVLTLMPTKERGALVGVLTSGSGFPLMSPCRISFPGGRSKNVSFTGQMSASAVMMYVSCQAVIRKGKQRNKTN